MEDGFEGLKEVVNRKNVSSVSEKRGGSRRRRRKGGEGRRAEGERTSSVRSHPSRTSFVRPHSIARTSEIASAEYLVKTMLLRSRTRGAGGFGVAAFCREGRRWSRRCEEGRKNGQLSPMLSGPNQVLPTSYHRKHKRDLY